MTESALTNTPESSVYKNEVSFELYQRMAKSLAGSNLVPVHYQGQEGLANCLVALEMANRMNISPLVVMQNMNVIHGKPSWSAQFITATIIIIWANMAQCTTPRSNTIITGNTNSLDVGILYARTIPLIVNDNVQVVIQVSAPLVAYGLKGTIHAILAHEFLHYLELVTRLSNTELLSDEISSNLFENVYSDNTRLLEPRSVFNDLTLISHITKRFPSGFRDYKLEDKVLKLWIQSKLPVSKISLDTNTIKLDAGKLSNIKFDELLLQQLEIIKAKNSKRRTKKLY